MKPGIILLYNYDCSWTPQDVLECEAERRRAHAALQGFGYEVLDVAVSDSVAEALRPFQVDPRDWLIFNWCEGYANRPWDYDGVTRELDQLGLVYTGADTRSLSLSANKARVQAILKNAGVPIPRGRIMRAGDMTGWSIFPAIVKPTNQHGSCGIDRDAIVLDRAQLRARLAYIEERFKAPAMVEEFITGRELQVTIWGNHSLEVLPEVEVVFDSQLNWRDRIYTYEIKFQAGALETHGVGFVCPSMLTIAQRRAIEHACCRAYRAMRCRDYARIDLRVQDDRVYVLDVNPNPDISSESLLVMAANVVGLNHDDVIARITQWGEERWRAAVTPTRVSRRTSHEQSTVIPQHI